MAVPAFRGVFGKTFAEMSNGERNDVARALKKCSKELWVEWGLAHPFKLPEGGDAKNWVRMFEQYDRSGQAEMRARAKKADAYVSNETPEAELKRRVYFVGDLLLETSLYKLYADNYTSDFDRRYGDGKGWQWCHADKRAALVTIIFKAGERYEVKGDDAYWARFESEVVPAVLTRCPGADTIYADHHVDGFYVYYGRSVGEEAKRGEAVQPVSRASYQISARKRSWTLFQPGGSSGVKADDKVTSIAVIRELLKAVDTKLASDTREWEAEKARKAEQLRQEQLARRRARDRTSSAEVLNLLEIPKGKAPMKYEFKGYLQSEVLQNIYSGDFEPFTGEHEPVDLLRAINPLNKEPDAVKFSKLMDIGRRRLPVTLAYFAYHQVYGDVCRSSRDIAWVEARFRYVHTTTNWWGMVIDRTEGQWFSYPVREPYAEAFTGAYEAANDGFFAHLLTGTSFSTKREFERDFRKFLVAEGCLSPSVRHFEVNLYLASQWMLPLQELR